MKVPSFARFIFNKYFFQKIFAISLLILIAYGLKQFVFLFLITFLFAYLFLSLGDFLSIKINEYLIKKCRTDKSKKYLRIIFSTNSIVLYLYILFIGLLVFAISGLLPKIIQELTDLPKSIPFLSGPINEVLAKLEEIKSFKQDIKGTIALLFQQSNYEIILKFIANLKSVGLVFIEFVISLIMSYVFIIDRKKIKKYLQEIQKGNFAFLYHEYAVIFEKISNGFGIIFKAQSIISAINTILTIISLYLISWAHGGDSFPYIFTLAIIVFIFGMIPVLGMFLSSIPIIMIGFAYGGVTVVIEILLMIVIIHMVEAYYLNPRIVSSYAELPISLTFLILIISEQLFGMAGLLIGVPIFYILVDVLKDFDKYIGKIKIAYDGINTLQKVTKNNIETNLRLSRSGKKMVK